MNPSTAFGVTFCDELIRCGLREVVLAPGSRSTPLAMAFAEAAQQERIRLHVRIDERSASFTALGLAKASRRPVAVLCTSGTAAANFHPAVIKAGESAVPLIVLTADRPPELRGTGANQTIDQIKLYGAAVRWFCEAGTPEARPGMAAYWRSLACQAWARAAGRRRPAGPARCTSTCPCAIPWCPAGRRSGRSPWTGGPAASHGRVSRPGRAGGRARAAVDRAGRGGLRRRRLRRAGPGRIGRTSGLAGAGRALVRSAPRAARAVRLPVPAGDAGIRPGPSARPDRLGRAARAVPGQSAFLGTASAVRHVVVAQGPGHWADPRRAATDVAAGLRLTGTPVTGTSGKGAWLEAWRRADEAARRAVDAVLDGEENLTEPRLARDLVGALPGGALLWIASSQPVRDIDYGGRPRADLHMLASRGASGIDGTTSSAIGAALAHGGPSFALIGDLALVHDAPGLALGPEEPRPDLCLVVVNNDGGGIFSTLEPAAFPASFERLFGTPHGTRVDHLAAAFGLPYQRLEHPGDLPKALQGHGLRIVEARTDRAAGAGLRARLRAAAAEAIRGL